MGPGGWLGACSCQLCTNSATSSVSFPVWGASVTMGGDIGALSEGRWGQKDAKR